MQALIKNYHYSKQCKHETVSKFMATKYCHKHENVAMKVKGARCIPLLLRKAQTGNAHDIQSELIIE